jgi:hypothetical protein
MKAKVVLAGFFLAQVFMMACTAPDTEDPVTDSQVEIQAIKALMENYVSAYGSKDSGNFVDVFTSEPCQSDPS